MSERRANIKLLPVRQPDAGILRRACKRPRCGNDIDPPAGRSRPREFCSDSCRHAYQREREQARNNLLEARRLAVQYDVDDVGTAGVGSDQARAQAEPDASLDGLPAAVASYLALALVAQTLESIRVELQDGQAIGTVEALARITHAKEQGDRLLRTYGV